MTDESKQRIAACLAACEGMDTAAVERLAGAGGVLRLARMGEKAAVQLAAALTDAALLREIIERGKHEP